MARCEGCIHTDVCNREVGYGYAKCPHYKSADVAPRAEVAKIIEEVKKKAEAYFWHQDSVSTSWFIEFCDDLKNKYTESEK